MITIALTLWRWWLISVQVAEWDVGGGVWVVPPLTQLAGDKNELALSRQFLLATSGLIVITNSTALVLAALLPRLGVGVAGMSAEWIGRAGLVVAACATVVLEKRDWCASPCSSFPSAPRLGACVCFPLTGRVCLSYCCEQVLLTWCCGL